MNYTKIAIFKTCVPT